MKQAKKDAAARAQFDATVEAAMKDLGQEGVWTRIRDGKVHLGAKFYGLDIDEKRTFARIAWLYSFRKGGSGTLELIDGLSGKTFGSYSPSTGCDF